MDNKSSFLVYNASAGSGKTFTLVKEYLKILVQSPFNDAFKNILAITFTNKAASEMKERIVETLTEFSSEETLENPNHMFVIICDELQMDAEELHKKSKKILNSIVYNYAAFDISTIDGFTHRIIRTFAYDLKLPLNFEVELDQEALLSEAVDSLISKAGTEKELTKILVDFAIEKADDDKSWDVSFDFNKISKLLVSEDDMPFLNALKDKTLDDFKALKKQLKNDIKTTEELIVLQAQRVLTLIEESGLQFDDFSGSFLPKHFQKLAKANFLVNWDSKWQVDIESKTLYPKRVSPDIASVIDAIQPEIASAFNETKKAAFHYKFLIACYRNITPLSVLNAINKELINLKEEQNKVLISEFNALISEEIKNQPTPFIYERLGDKFKNYFIDEFQDTSVLQWENLKPLIDNSLSQENNNDQTGSVMLVGDAKQAIYRWRGGKAEQFIDLFNKANNPFQVSQDVINLPNNFRSFQEVLKFNNGFFEFLSQSKLNNEDYAQLYQNSYQEPTKKEEGFVSVEFLDIGKEDDAVQLYTEKTMERIQTVLDNGFSYSDICILVRKKKEGIAIANYLNEQQIPLISSETLLLINSPEVNFVISFLKLLQEPKNNEIKIQVLNYLAGIFKVEDKHAFFESYLSLGLSEMLKQLEEFNIYINQNQLLQLSLFELAETVVRDFNLVKTSNAYVQYFLDFVFEYSQKKLSDLAGFLEHFEKKQDNLSIVSPLGQDAVQIMTIHKSKGLEFPVVIFPFADLDIYREIEPKEWFPLNKDSFQGFPYALLNFNKDFEYFGEVGHQIYNKHRAEQELDNINLFYVALTRAVEQLHIISKKDVKSKGEVNDKTYSGFLISYLIYLNLWDENQMLYNFGNPLKTSPRKPLSKDTMEQTNFISTPKQEHNIKIVTNSGYLWNTAQEDAIEKGNLIHNIMSQIKTNLDVDFVLDDFMDANIITIEQAQVLKKIVLDIVEHKDLNAYFNTEESVYNERDIIAKSGGMYRPDRLVFENEKNVVLIDYKTGAIDRKHINQLEEYESILTEMNIKVRKKILVYINDGIEVKEF
ncbi:UvrD-helicase domain-containing protein [Xanthomarina sp. F1114]|uniref:UvrD-helicase domain-containing protein n=1 Tax=Xanthomarina sp. F1114 TaxID=2996019 RepID=UPI00225E54A7|nr:UvrD-helicase domain-containing protein [Xanthomarina sp. F1114]MCX7546511.1 UvrD-helicase domain-containing protein [Xanthomarina sp. F1114]